MSSIIFAAFIVDMRQMARKARLDLHMLAEYLQERAERGFLSFRGVWMSRI